MNKTQSAKLDSLKLIVKESKINPDTIVLVPNFGVAIDRIDAICAEIESYQVEQEKDLTGITTDKDVVLGNLKDFNLEIAGAVYAYAHNKHDNSLMAKVNYNSTSFTKMTQAEVVAVACVILEEAGNIPPGDLASEGISPEELTAYEKLISLFKVIRTSKHEAVIESSGTTENLGILFREAKELVNERLDKLAIQFKRKDPDFYRRYLAARGKNKRSKKLPKAEPVVTPEEPVVR